MVQIISQFHARLKRSSVAAFLVSDSVILGLVAILLLVSAIKIGRAVPETVPKLLSFGVVFALVAALSWNFTEPSAE